MLPHMKRLLLVLACTGFFSASVFAGCDGCGEKGTEGEKGEDSTKQSLAVVF